MSSSLVLPVKRPKPARPIWWPGEFGSTFLWVRPTSGPFLQNHRWRWCGQTGRRRSTPPPLCSWMLRSLSLPAVCLWRDLNSAQTQRRWGVTIIPMLIFPCYGWRFELIVGSVCSSICLPVSVSKILIMSIMPAAISVSEGCQDRDMIRPRRPHEKKSKTVIIILDQQTTKLHPDLSWTNVVSSSIMSHQRAQLSDVTWHMSDRDVLMSTPVIWKDCLWNSLFSHLSVSQGSFETESSLPVFQTSSPCHPHTQPDTQKNPVIKQLKQRTISSNPGNLGGKA